MAVTTLRPDGTTALGSWTVVGAASAHAALNDSSDSSYVQLVTRCRTESQLLRLSIQDLSIPAGAKIFSVRTRIRIQTVTGTQQPRCLGWFRCRKPRNLIALIIYIVFRILFGWRCPRTATVTWVDQDLEYMLVDPDGAEWTIDSFNDFEVQLGRDDADGNPLRIAAVYVDVNYNLPPTIAVTAPTGTITDVGRLTVTWTYTDPQSDPQQAFLVRIFSADQYGAPGFDPMSSVAYDESGWTFGEQQSWTMNRDVPNGIYRAYLRVQKVWLGAGTYPSDIVFSQWTQSVAGAPTPNLTAEFEPAFNRVRLILVPSSADPATVGFTLERSTNLGISWEIVRGGSQIPANAMNPITVFDHEAPLNTPIQYRALGFRQVGDSRYPSDFSPTVQVICETTEFWLKDPLAPGMNSPLPVRAQGNDQPTQPRSVGVFEPLVAEGREARKVVVVGPLWGVEGRMNLVFTERYQPGLWERFQTLYGTGRTLLRQDPTGEQHYIRLGGDLAWVWDLDETNVRYRFATVSYTEVVRPPLEEV